MYKEPLPSSMVVKANPVSAILSKYCVSKEDEGDSRIKPYVGLEFDSADDARDFYNAYAMHCGFRIRIGQLYRSRIDGSVASRRFVCAKEGFQLNSRTGCPAYMRVKRLDSGKWVLDHFQNDHNHDLELPGEICPTLYQGKTVATSKSLADVSPKSIADSLDEDRDGDPYPSGVVNVKRRKRQEEDEEDEEETPEPCVGLEFSSADEAHKFFHAYATAAGFKMRIGQLFRSKNDGSITSRRFVCSKEGHQHPSRVGCGAFMRIKRQETGSWVVDRLSKEHNHSFGLDPKEICEKSLITPINFKDEASTPLVSNDSRDNNNENKNNIKSYCHHALFEYFQSRQAEDTGFFYAIDIEDGKCKSIFWADGRSRFSCSQFGDAIVFDTTYRRTNCLVPFAAFIGVNHHKQPVLLGCALMANESKESFTWVFETYLRAMSGRVPVSIIADEDKAIEQAISQSFANIHHCFSMWEMKIKEEENLGELLSFGNEFKDDYERCIYQSQTPGDFDSSWINLLEKYRLKENSWLKEIYRKRRNWVPLYLRDTFFAGIPISGVVPSFGAFFNAQTPFSEFVIQYERALEQRLEEERKEDINSITSQPILHTKEPIEEQCRRLYTTTIFTVFQKQLIDSFSYFSIKIYEEGIESKYLVKNSGNENEQHSVTLTNGSNPNANCSCQMFEFEGVICRHALNVFRIRNVRELPSCLVLHRWTKNAKYGMLSDIASGGGLLDVKALMIWSLREEACKFIEAGATSIERFKLAHEIMREGGRNFSWQN